MPQQPQQSSEERCEDSKVVSKVPKVPKAKRKAAKAKSQSPVKETQQPQKGAEAVVGADGVPLKRCVGKRKVGSVAVQRSPRSADAEPPAAPAACHESQETKESPEEHLTPPPKNKDPPGSGSKSKKPKARTEGKARAQSSKKEASKPDEPQAHSLEKAFAEQAQEKAEPEPPQAPPGESPKPVKKLKIVKSKAKNTKAVNVDAGDTTTVKEVDKTFRPKAKTSQGIAQVPIRRLLVKRGSGADDEVAEVVEKDSRPKWKKKLLRIGKGGKKLDIAAEDEKTLEACFAGKRKAEVPAEAEASKKGLLRLGFYPVGKEEQNEAAKCKKSNPNEEQQEANEVEVVDLESKRPRFDWKQGFAKLSIPTPQTKAPKEEGGGVRTHQAPDLETSPASPKGGASKLSKQGSKDLTPPKVPKVDWCERHAPNVLKQLKPQKAWQDLRDWLKSWRPNRKGREAAIVTGPCGSGKTAGVRYLVRKWHGQFMEYDLADAQGRSFFENLAKKQRNGNQLSDEALSQVLVCNISEQITTAQKECLALAVQASVSPIIFTSAEGIFGAKDAIHKMCLEIRISLTETFVAKQIHEISQREQLELPLQLCHTVANACRCDLRKALQVAQLLSVLSGSGQACLPQAARAPMTACERLLRNLELSFEDAMTLVELDDEVPMLLRWNLLPSLSFAWCRRRIEEVNSVAKPVEPVEPVGRPEDLEADTLPEAMEVAAFTPAEVPKEEAEERSEAAPESEEPEKMDVDTVEEREAINREGEPEKMDVDAFEAESARRSPQEPVDVPEAAVDAEDADAEGEKRKQAMPSSAFNEQELQDLETCARMTSLLALSDVTGHLALQAAEQAGPTVEDLGVPCVAAEPLLLAIMSREAQSFGASSQTAKKHFQPTKFLQDPVCPISMDQVAVLAMQLDVPKAWVLDRIYDWIAASRQAAGQRHLKNFRNWLKRQVQLWHQRQGRCLKSMGALSSEPTKSPDADADDTLEVEDEVAVAAVAGAEAAAGEVDEESLS